VVTLSVRKEYLVKIQTEVLSFSWKSFSEGFETRRKWQRYLYIFCRYIRILVPYGEKWLTSFHMDVDFDPENVI